MCNPSAVAAPDQRGCPTGDLRFVMSVRQIGEGHHSSIGFRPASSTGSARGDRRARTVHDRPGTIEDGTLDADLFREPAERPTSESTVGARRARAPFTRAELDAA